ncbi:prepilin-type N-terminal cleavage/methylation domain-containing protein [Thiomicrorhabdus sp. 6S2-11]|uniref:Prepilin-type N-terminal cleavage/methylation domain-containing protein n=1 Tax=Thiomicrorhabdus marina TaxID=2818442 RepID=A0ABS3Q3Q2_9GAMM|nr:type II secretion system protein [Thiomicrorhabdus marina]MBO1926957.1 prepilin-type N-terminal cleavage/methylation domain-containing protein [Thiomicrorhabdus marina]
MISFKFKEKMQLGFTLVEIAIVLMIVGLLIGGGVSTIGAYLDNARQNHTKNNLELTKRATLDFVMVNYHMPCPDTDGDGRENRDADNKACSSAKGTVPYVDIGRSLADSSDDYGNVFAYGVTLDVTDQAQIVAVTGIATDELYGEFEPSYFANQDVTSEANTNKPSNYEIPIILPLFGLDTPPTSQTPATANKNYVVCKKTAVSCSSASPAVDIEVEDIPAVIVAFNENGNGITLSSCNGSNWGALEEENCNDDLYLLKNYFSDGVYDDQMVTISAYEIKQQVLDRLNSFNLESKDGPNYGGYEVIYLRNVDNANDLNVGNGEDNSFYIGAKQGEDGEILDVDGDGVADEAGDLSAVVNLKDGDDRLYLEGSVVTGGNADLGDGDDRLTVEGSIIGIVTMGTGSDISIIQSGVSGTFDAGDGNDTIDIYGTISDGAVVSSGGKDNKESDNDTLTFHGSVMDGEIDMGDGNDTMRFTASSGELSFGVNAIIDGESGNNTLEVENMTLEEFETLIGESASDNSGKFRNFNEIQLKN